MVRVGIDHDGTYYPSVGNCLAAVNNAHRRFGLEPISMETLKTEMESGYLGLDARLGVPDNDAEQWRIMFRNVYEAMPLVEIVPGTSHFLKRMNLSGERPVIITAESTDIPERVLKKNGLWHLVSRVERVNYTHSKKDILEGLDFYAGDTTSDAKDAIAAGVHFVGVAHDESYVRPESLVALAEEHPGKMTVVFSLPEAAQAVHDLSK